MKKLLLMMLLIANVNAAGLKDWYVGAGFFGGSGEETVSTTTEYSSGGADIKFGVLFASNNRFEFSAITINAKTAGGTTSTFKGRDFDWIFTPVLNNQESVFLPFISVGFGAYEYATINGVSGQVGLGAYFMVVEDVEVELSYKNKAIVWNTTPDASERMSNFYVGAKYKF